MYLENKNVMTINTRDFGQQEINKDSILNFPSGIFAFEDAKRFALICPMGGNESPMWLQNIDDIAPCFIVFDPNQLVENYAPEITDIDKASVGYSEGDVLRYLSIAVVKDNLKESTLNLKCPILVNATKSIAAQVILSNDYDIKYPAFNIEQEG